MTPTHGSAIVPVPLAAVHVGVPESTNTSSWLKMFVSGVSPLAACVTSAMKLNVTVSSDSFVKLLFATRYWHSTGSPTFVGVSQPFWNPIPC